MGKSIKELEAIIYEVKKMRELQNTYLTDPKKLQEREKQIERVDILLGIAEPKEEKEEIDKNQLNLFG